MSDPIKLKNNLQFDYDNHAWCVHVGFEMGRLEFIFNNQSFDEELNLISKQAQDEIITSIKPILSSKGFILHDEYPDYHSMNGALLRDLELSSSQFFSFYMIGMAVLRLSMANGIHENTFLDIAKSCIESIPAQYLEDKEEFFHILRMKKFHHVIQITDFLTSLKNATNKAGIVTNIQTKKVRVHNNLKFDYDEHAWCVHVGFQMGRLEGIFNNQGFDLDMNRLLMDTQLQIVGELKSILSSKGIELHDELPDYYSMNRALMRDLELASGRYFSFYMIGMAVLRISMVDAASGKYEDEMLSIARSCIESIPSQYLIDKDLMYEKLVELKFRKTVHVTDFLTKICAEQPETKMGGNEMEEKYIDFDLHIAPNGHAIASSPQGNATTNISLDVPNNIRLSLRLIENRTVDVELLKEVGQTLYNWIFPGPIHTHFHQTETAARLNNEKIRIRLRIEAEEIANLPLEFMYRELGGYFLSINPATVLSRYLHLPLPPERVRRREGPLHLLAIIADPVDQTRLSPDDWETIIQESLAKPLANGQMTLQTVKRATRKEIRNALLNKKPDIVQFVGHGIYQDDIGYLALVDDDTDKTWLVTDDRFANLFLGFDDRLGLISLATCESAKSKDPQGFLGIAPKLVQRGVPAVLSMQYKVYVKTAKIFLEDFYMAIAERKPIDWAAQSARNAIGLEFGLDNREFATPVLYMRAEDGNLF